MVGKVCCDMKGTKKLLVGVVPVIGWDPIETDPISLQDMSSIQDREVLKHRITSFGAFLKRQASS
jgi:hypothetical protein